MKRIITYSFYVLGLLLLVYYSINHLEEARSMAGNDFNLLPPMLFSSVYSIMIGVYIALPGFLNTLRGVGKVYVDWLKILNVGIPTLFVSISGVLYHYIIPLSSLFQWIYFKFSMMGTALIGVACGYTLLSSISKEAMTDVIQARKYPIAKIFTIAILAISILYISFNGLIHPVTLVAVHADIVETDNNTGYLINDGKDTVFFIRTEINYTLQFKNLPYKRSGILNQSVNDYKIRIEPKEKLRSLVQDEIFRQTDGHDFSASGNMIEIRLIYVLGSIDPEGKHSNVYPPSMEVLKEIKNYLYDAELVIEFNDKQIKRFDLSDYIEN